MKSRNFSFYLMFLISPIVMIFYGFLNKDIKTKKSIFIIFISIYGFTAFFEEGTDASRHLLNVANHYSSLGFEEFFNESIAIFNFQPNENTNDDIFIHILSFLAGYFNSPRLLYFLVSIIYGFFLVESIFLILQRFKDENRGFLLFFFILYFVLWKNVEGINSIRNHTGAWVLFYGILNYLETKNKKFLFFVFLSILIHFQYFLIVVPVLIVTLTRLPKFFYLILFVASFIFSIPKSAIVQNISNTELGQNKSKSYIKDDDYLNKRDQIKFANTRFYTNVAKTNLIYFSILSAALIIIFSGIYFNNMNSFEGSLFSIGLSMISLANILEDIPAVYSRIYSNAGLYVLAVFVLVIQNRSLHNGFLPKFIINLLLYSLVLFCLSVLIFKISLLLTYSSIFLFCAPFFALIMGNEVNISIREVLGWFL
ncbi:MAG: EpsG family protein [Algoriphagus sp.]|uniref:EpsG family protein n=1 Tax=Algoriphagus sp. TaxID=1872435 RepID=UPI00261611FE|nr:EpsG family protein [Algoriphagus sp.]MDG1279040.1 EpsG family protein [Algoriphagus sp.]